MLKLLVNSLFFNLHINLAFRWVTNTHLLRLHCANACPGLLCFLASDDHSDHSCPCTYPPLYKHTKRSFESIQKIMPLLCYKLPSKCHGSQKNIQSWFWGRRHVGWGHVLCVCVSSLCLWVSHFICILCILPTGLGSGSFLSLGCPSQVFAKFSTF